MPATTRELAKEYLLSIQKDFKVGFLFTKKKTEEKKQEILKNFLEAVQENTNTQITWHLKQMFANLVKKYRSLNHELEIDIQKLTIPVTTELIQGTVKQGALVTGESVLLFTNDVAEKIKRETRSRTNEIFMKLKQSVKKNNDKEYEQLQSKRIELEKFIQAQQELAQLDHKYSDLKNQLQSIYQASEHQLDQNMISYSLSLLQEKQQEAIIEEMKSKKNEEQLADRKIEKNVQKFHKKTSNK